MLLVDSHCHLDCLDYKTVHKDIDDVIKKAHAAGVTHFLCPSTDLEHFPAMYDLIKPFKEVYAAVAMHPENLYQDPPSSPEEYKKTSLNWSADLLKQYLAYDKVIAMGETGLEYVCLPEETHKLQRENFGIHAEIAAEMKKPLIVHARASAGECIDIIKASGADNSGGVMHCYCDSIENARKALNMGFFISFSGILTFKHGDNVREVFRYVPLDRMLVETDCPYLTPVPMRGKPNEPAYVSYTAHCAADLLGIPFEKFAEKTAHNFAECFHVDLSAAASVKEQLSSGGILL